MFAFTVYFSYICPDYTDTKHLYPAKEPYGTHKRRPSRNAAACNNRNYRIYKEYETKYTDYDTCIGNNFKRLDAERGYSVNGKSYHFFQRVF